METKTPPPKIPKGVTSPSTDEATLPDFFGDKYLEKLKSKYLKSFNLYIMDINNPGNNTHREKIKSVVDNIVDDLLKYEPEVVLRNWKPQQAYTKWEKRGGIYQLYLPAFTLYLEKVKKSKAYAAAKEKIRKELTSKELTKKLTKNIKVGIEIECVTFEDNPGFAEKYEAENVFQELPTSTKIKEFIKKIIKKMKKFMSTDATFVKLPTKKLYEEFYTKLADSGKYVITTFGKADVKGWIFKKKKTTWFVTLYGKVPVKVKVSPKIPFEVCKSKYREIPRLKMIPLLEKALETTFTQLKYTTDLSTWIPTTDGSITSVNFKKFGLDLPERAKEKGGFRNIEWISNGPKHWKGQTRNRVISEMITMNDRIFMCGLRDEYYSCSMHVHMSRIKKVYVNDHPFFGYWHHYLWTHCSGKLQKCPLFRKNASYAKTTPVLIKYDSIDDFKLPRFDEIRQEMIKIVTKQFLRLETDSFPSKYNNINYKPSYDVMYKNSEKKNEWHIEFRAHDALFDIYDIKEAVTWIDLLTEFFDKAWENYLKNKDILTQLIKSLDLPQTYVKIGNLVPNTFDHLVARDILELNLKRFLGKAEVAEDAEVTEWNNILTEYEKTQNLEMKLERILDLAIPNFSKYPLVENDPEMELAKCDILHWKFENTKDFNELKEEIQQIRDKNADASSKWGHALSEKMAWRLNQPTNTSITDLIKQCEKQCKGAWDERKATCIANIARLHYVKYNAHVIIDSMTEFKETNGSLNGTKVYTLNEFGIRKRDDNLGFNNYFKYCFELFKEWFKEEEIPWSNKLVSGRSGGGETKSGGSRGDNYRVLKLRFV